MTRSNFLKGCGIYVLLVASMSCLLSCWRYKELEEERLRDRFSRVELLRPIRHAARMRGGLPIYLSDAHLLLMAPQFDAWGNYYRFRRNGFFLEVSSPGADRKWETSDDVLTWVNRFDGSVNTEAEPIRIAEDTFFELGQSRCLADTLLQEFDLRSLEFFIRSRLMRPEESHRTTAEHSTIRLRSYLAQTSVWSTAEGSDPLGEAGILLALFLRLSDTVPSDLVADLRTSLTDPGQPLSSWLPLIMPILDREAGPRAIGALDSEDPRRVLSALAILYNLGEEAMIPSGQLKRLQDCEDNGIRRIAMMCDADLDREGLLRLLVSGNAEDQLAAMMWIFYHECADGEAQKQLASIMVDNEPLSSVRTRTAWAITYRVDKLSNIAASRVLRLGNCAPQIPVDKVLRILDQEVTRDLKTAITELLIANIDRDPELRKGIDRYDTRVLRLPPSDTWPNGNPER